MQAQNKNINKAKGQMRNMIMMRTEERWLKKCRKQEG